jgi:hypothetical protein
MHMLALIFLHVAFHWQIEGSHEGDQHRTCRILGMLD